ncbi:amidohydrolase/deacetylase family metallohydrolase [uncultured Paludibaculum sp.]|uniref:amidohydrolase/deacetylase family metallohydrolase n=1 Tax=uncultured Paludibaculum sp. TaxID=1765020 RepID=UPI002AAB43E2|nr:amidohydrolase/deacetylase family metallohydrolase [uncultured Paludibaculum sp.]
MRLALILLLTASAWAQTRYDMLLKGGRVIDPKNNINAVMDVAVKDGKIAAVAPNLPASDASKVIDVAGLIVTPGLLDMHAHVFSTTGVADAWAGDNSVRPDDFSFRTGVTAMADAGSSGWRNFEQFKLTVIDRARTKVFAFINIAGLGMMTNIVEQHPEDMKPEELARLAKKFPDVVVGVKTAHWESPAWTAVDKALEAGRLMNKPIMVDFGYFKPERPYWQLVTQKLRPGDISTHAFRATVPWIDAKGKIYSYLQQARDRGVIFDTGHGGGSFAWRNAVPAIAQGFYPDTISTDLHTDSMNGAMMDMPTTMSKFLAMGMPLDQVILRSTWRPAQVIHHEEVGHLTVGAEANIAAFALNDGKFNFMDSDKGTFPGKQRLQCELTIRAGKIVWDWNARSGVDYRTLGPAYGVRAGESIVPPPQ